jgi:phytoene dehydrogenase-like protein
LSKQDYDVIIIGSGIGGLGGGALLSHWGYKTLVLEKLNVIGGRCSTEEEQGFKLPTGAVTLVATDIEDIFKEVECRLELVNVPRLMWRIAGKDYEMPPKGAIGAIFKIINDLEEGRASEFNKPAELLPTEKILDAFKKAYKEPELAVGLNFKDWLSQYTDNDILHSVFNAITNAIPGTPYFEIPAASVFAWFSVMGGSREMCIAPKGNLVNMENLARIVKANGDLWLDSQAKHIIIGDGEAKGVIVEREGKEIEITCQVVISDIGPKATVELVGGENFNEDYLGAVRLTHKPNTTCHCFVASDRPLWPESGDPAILMIENSRRLKAVVPLSNISSHFAPPGQHLMFCLAPATTSEVTMDPEVEKTQLLLDLQEQFPLFIKYGRVLKIVVKNVDNELPAIRAMLNNMMPNDTPINNLYNVGDATCEYGLIGATGAAKTGRQVAEIIKKYYKPN